MKKYPLFLVPMLALIGLLFSGCQSTPQTHYMVYKSNQLPSPISQKTYKIEAPANTSANDSDKQSHDMALRVLDSTLRLYGWVDSDNPAYIVSLEYSLHNGVQPPAEYRRRGSAAKQQAFIRIGGSKPKAEEPIGDPSEPQSPEIQEPELWKNRTHLYTKQVVLSFKDAGQPDAAPIYYANGCAIDDKQDLSSIPILLGTILQQFPGPEGKGSSRYQGPTPKLIIPLAPQ